MSRATLSRWALRVLIPLLVIAAVLVIRNRPRNALLATVDRGSVRLDAAGTGTLESDERVAIAFTVSGRITALAVDEGDHVKAGQHLATIDAADTQKQLAVARASESLAVVSVARAEADVARARVVAEAADADLERIESLATSGSVSSATRDDARERSGRSAAELKAARATLEQVTSGTAVARASTSAQARRLDDTLVTSPFDGVVVSRSHVVGDVVGPGVTVVTIASTRKLRARVWIDETALSGLREGEPAQVTLRSSAERPLAGVVERVAAEADRQTHEVLVDIELKERPARLAFGQRVDASITLSEKGGVVRARRRFCDVASRSCLVAREGRVVRAPVEFGLVGSEWVEIARGLGPGDRLVAAEEAGTPLAVGDRVKQGGT